MDPVRNPFAPGAGAQPPELAGRGAVIEAVGIALQRVLHGRHDRSQILLGLRGVGKTVLLNKFEELAEQRGFATSFIEAPEGEALAQLLYPKLHQALRKLSAVESAKASAHRAMRALRSFASAFKIKIGDVSISVDPEAGVADSGQLDLDLVDLFVRVGETAQAANSGWALLIDEVQYLSEVELSALIVALHRISQKGLPVILFGAGLPQLAALSGEAKSYSERLFNYSSIGPLDLPSAIQAVRQPIEEEEESIDNDAMAQLIADTGRYPYFLQEWGYQAWNVAEHSPISLADLQEASMQALKRLDEGFFRVRIDRLTPKEREYVVAMARLGKGPYKSGDVAAALGESTQALGPRRAAIIRKGMIYSPQHGDVDFTVPMFDSFLRRTFE